MPLTVDPTIDNAGGAYVPPNFPSALADAGYCGRSFNQGLIRFHDGSSAPEFTEMVREAFPEIPDPDAGVVAFDWMGRQLVSLRTRAEDGTWGEVLIHIADLGTGTLYEAATPAEFGGALRNGAIEEALDAQTFTDWRAANGVPTATLGFDECIEYDVPLFLGGDDTVRNMGVTDTSVLWTVVGQVRAQSLELPEGSAVAVTPPSEG
ncbi:hypothetical protein ACEXQD_07225 [Herbiconiux sp. P15]|uniref:hypothetical protein n=1 Tax=Herbiconiux liukaitaii TaxID=3342799 RepID=UPI0035BA8A40